MHIVFLVHHFPVKGKATGGAANYVVNMAKIMLNHGHMVEVITESEKEDVFEWDGIIIHNIRATKWFRNTGRQMPTYKKLLKNIWRSYWYNKKVACIDKKRKVDLVQSVNNYGIPLFRKGGIPYIVRLSSYPSLWGGANRPEFNYAKCIKSKRLDEELQFIALKKADSLIVPSVLMQKLIYDKIKIQPYLVESPVLVTDNNSLFLREEFERNQYFLTFSELNYRKSIHIVAQIIDDLLDLYPNMKYVVVGKDREIFYHNQYILVSKLFELHVVKNRNRFIFMNEISDRTRLFSIIKYARICILPTRMDNLPNTILEAMAFGKIVISTTCDNGTSVEQLITDGDNGFLAQVDDARGLYQKIVEVMQLPIEEKKNIENKAKERVQNLMPEKVYKKMMEVYEETVTNF